MWEQEAESQRSKAAMVIRQDMRKDLERSSADIQGQMPRQLRQADMLGKERQCDGMAKMDHTPLPMARDLALEAVRRETKFHGQMKDVVELKRWHDAE